MVKLVSTRVGFLWRQVCTAVNIGGLNRPIATLTTIRIFLMVAFPRITAGRQRTPPGHGVIPLTKIGDGSIVTSTTAVSSASVLNRRHFLAPVYFFISLDPCTFIDETIRLKLVNVILCRRQKSHQLFTAIKFRLFTRCSILILVWSHVSFY